MNKHKVEQPTGEVPVHMGAQALSCSDVFLTCAQGNVCWLLKSPLGCKARCVGTTSHPVPGAPIFEALRGGLAARDVLGQRSQTAGFDFGVALGALRAWTGAAGWGHAVFMRLSNPSPLTAAPAGLEGPAGGARAVGRSMGGCPLPWQRPAPPTP